MATYSIIQKSQLEGGLRLDAEYYHPEKLELMEESPKNLIPLAVKAGNSTAEKLLQEVRFKADTAGVKILFGTEASAWLERPRRVKIQYLYVD